MVAPTPSPPSEELDPSRSAVAMLKAHLSRQCADASALFVTDYEHRCDAEVDAVVQTALSLLAQALESLDVVSVLYGDILGEGQSAEGQPTNSPSANGRSADGQSPDSLSANSQSPDSQSTNSQSANSQSPDSQSPGDPLPGGGPRASPPPASQSRPGDDSPPSSLMPEAVDIADVVVLARLGLRSRMRSVRALGPASTRWERLSAVGSALRTIQKSLSAVDRAMSRAVRIAPSFDFYDHAVERSLDVRRRYVHFHRRVTRTSLSPPATVVERVRFLGNAITQLLGSRAGAHLRTGDRALLMMSHARAREWLSHRDDDAAHQAAGLRLCQDIVNVATMFLDVSKREELVQHDARLVREVCAEIACPGQPFDVAALLERLRPMWGRAPSLDALLEAAPGGASAAELRRVLGELERTLASELACGAAPSAG